MRTFVRCAVFAVLLQFIVAQPARTAPPLSDSAEASPGTAAIEKLLVGTWYGPSCGGDYTFNADHTFDVKHFTPGNNSLTGTWTIRWDALPPTLVLTFKTSDFKKKDPTREEYPYVGKDREPKLLELNKKEFAFHEPSDKWAWYFSRDPQEGGHVKEVKD